jgi:hypothetical protein
MKKCPRCKITKPYSEFVSNRARSNGIATYCRKCDWPANREIRKRYRETVPNMIKKSAGNTYRKRRIRLKYTVMSYYSKCDPECACPGCKDKHMEFLTMDHIDGGGTKARREGIIKRGSTEFYKWLIDNDYPGGFQVLCFNCNFGKHVCGICPHVGVSNDQD